MRLEIKRQLWDWLVHWLVAQQGESTYKGKSFFNTGLPRNCQPKGVQSGMNRWRIQGVPIPIKTLNQRHRAIANHLHFAAWNVSVQSSHLDPTPTLALPRQCPVPSKRDALDEVEGGEQQVLLGVGANAQQVMLAEIAIDER